MIRYGLIFLVIFIYGCSSSDQDRSNHLLNKNIKGTTKIYYSSIICDNNGHCDKSKPILIESKYIFDASKSLNDEFYIKEKDDNYEIFYKNLMVDNVEMGWAKLSKLNLNHQEMIFEVNKVYQTYGSMNTLGKGDPLEDVQSNHAKEGIYYIDDYYNKYAFNQKQTIKLDKQKDGSLLVNCEEYIKKLDSENHYSGIMYGICNKNKKVYFQLIK